MERSATASDDRSDPDDAALEPPADGSRYVVLSDHQRRLIAHPLTQREVAVLRLLARGLTNRQIADALGIAESTAKARCLRLFRRIGARNRTEAAVWAVSNGLAPGEPH